MCKQLSEAWQGKRVDRSFILELLPECEAGLADQLALADRLAPFMAGAKQIAGNPRLIKRFLNTLSIRLSIARAQNVQVDEGAIAKMLLFERFGFTEAYTELIKAITESADGKPRLLKPWEEAASAGQEIPDLPPAWDREAIRDWLKLAPAYADLDLRGVVHVSREHTPIITMADRLSTETTDAMKALLAMTGPNELVYGKVRAVPTHELPIVMDKLIERAKEAQDWGRPPILYALLAMTKEHSGQARTLVNFLSNLPGAQLKASIVPLIGTEPWSTQVFAVWKKAPGVGTPVINAIKNQDGGK